MKTRRYLNLRMGLGRGLSLRVVERPGRALEPEGLNALVAELQAIAQTVLPGGDLEYGVLGGDRERLDNSVVTVIYERKQPVAFNALALMDATLAGRPVEILHLGLVMVDPALRGRGLSEMLYGLTCMLIFLRRRCRSVRLSNVTQVPAVVGMVTETFDQVFPAPDWTRGPSFAHRTLARQIMARHRHLFGVGPEATFDEERSVILDSYTGGSDDLKKTFDAAPKHRKDIYNEMCREGLDYDRGDDFLQIGQLNMEAARRYLDRVARPLAGAQFAGSLVLFAVQSALLPAIHWFDAREPMGRLRPFRNTAP